MSKLSSMIAYLTLRGFPLSTINTLSEREIEQEYKAVKHLYERS